jgi:MoxR-like ATPase
LKLQVSFPPADEEDRILGLYQGRGGLGHPLELLNVDQATPGHGTLSRADILKARQAMATVTAKPEVCAYLGKITRLTRGLDQVLMGASSRAAVHMLQAAKARALMSGRTFVIPDDVKRVCRPVLRHRLTLQPDAYIEGFTSDDILTTVLERVEVPR